MSYSVVGLGAAKAAQQCQGGEVSEDGLGNHGDHCCKVSTWSAATYRAVKGKRSWRRWREKVLRLALESMFAPSDMGLPTKIHQVAFDAGLHEKAAVSQDLVNKIATAFHNFLILFPPGRWYKKEDCKRGDYDDGVCTGGEKTLSCWKSNNPPHTPEMAALLSSVVGVPITVQHLQSIGEWDQPYFKPALGGGQPPQVPQAFMDWLMSVYSQWQHMPLAMNGHYAGNEKLPKTENFFAVQGGVVKPTAWMGKFIEHMTRKSIKLQLAPSQMRRAASAKPKLVASSAFRRVTTAKPTQEGTTAPAPPRPAPPQPEGMDPKMLAIGGVALVGIGFGVFVLTRKK